MDGCPAARLVCSGLRLGLALADSQDLGVDDGVAGDHAVSVGSRRIDVLGLRCDG